MLQAAFRILGLFFLLTFSVTGLAQKTDKVHLRNGDVLTGEIKHMKFAMLTFKMDGPGTIQIKWEFITKIITDKKFQITLRNGDVSITKMDSLFFESKKVILDDIVEIVPIKDKFLQRIYGDINLGFNYAKSNDNLQFNFNNSMTYRKPKSEGIFKLNSVITNNSKDTLVSKKQDATVNVLQYLKNSLYFDGLFGWQQNTELGLQNRYLLSLGTGKIIVNNNRRRLLTGAGLTYNVEQSSESTAYKGNLEGLIGCQYKEFRYSSPKISIDTKFSLYPSLSDWGRVRMDFQLNSKIEIFKDFNVGLNIYDVFDNRPPEGSSSKNDYGINFTLGYEFGK